MLLLGTQWYILFNVIAGAMALPTDLKEVCDVFHLGTIERWRHLLLPGIFPFLITGLVTASGGAWNASIVAEYFRFQGRTFSTIGLGQSCDRHRELQRLAGRYRRYGSNRGDHKPSRLETALRTGFHQVQTGGLSLWKGWGQGSRVWIIGGWPAVTPSDFLNGRPKFLFLEFLILGSYDGCCVSECP